MFPQYQVREWQHLSNIRWWCRASSCKSALLRLKCIVTLLEETSADDTETPTVSARGLLAQVDGEFAYLLQIFYWHSWESWKSTWTAARKTDKSCKSNGAHFIGSWSSGKYATVKTLLDDTLKRLKHSAANAKLHQVLYENAQKKLRSWMTLLWWKRLEKALLTFIQFTPASSTRFFNLRLFTEQRRQSFF